jgi:hypothetical protein
MGLYHSSKNIMKKILLSLLIISFAVSNNVMVSVFSSNDRAILLFGACLDVVGCGLSVIYGKELKT